MPNSSYFSQAKCNFDMALSTTPFLNKFRVDCDNFSVHGFITYRFIVGWYVQVIIIVLQVSPGTFDIFQVDIVVGTPGRLDDLVSTGKLNLSQVRFLVLDEAVS